MYYLIGPIVFVVALTGLLVWFAMRLKSKYHFTSPMHCKPTEVTETCPEGYKDIGVVRRLISEVDPPFYCSEGEKVRKGGFLSPNYLERFCRECHKL